MHYFKRPHPFRRWRTGLSILLPALAIVWLAWAALTRNDRVYSSGKMSAGHAVLAARCGECHVRNAGSFSAKASDRACLTCHDGPTHHANQMFTPNCSSCHTEHRGHRRLSVTPDANCTQCHGNLRTAGAPTQFANHIEGFGSAHPEFAALRPGSIDPGAIKLNHAIHMKAKLQGPNGPVQLDCDDCHRPTMSSDAWRFGSAQTATNSVPGKFDPPSRSSARDYMAPISYANNCIACHTLQF